MARPSGEIKQSGFWRKAGIFRLGCRPTRSQCGKNAHAARNEITRLRREGSEVASRVCEATARFTDSLVLAAEALVRAEDQVAIFELSEGIAKEALMAGESAFNALQDASDNGDDRDKVEAARRSEDLALRQYRAREI